jgi:hypothetical protein
MDAGLDAPCRFVLRSASLGTMARAQSFTIAEASGVDPDVRVKQGDHLPIEVGSPEGYHGSRKRRVSSTPLRPRDQCVADHALASFRIGVTAAPGMTGLLPYSPPPLIFTFLEQIAAPITGLDLVANAVRQR